VDESPPPEVLASNRWYTLTEHKDELGIWESGAEGDPVRVFPRSDEGSEEAWAELRRLTRHARLHRGLPSLLFRVVVVGAVVWIVTGAIYLTLYVLETSNFLDFPGFPTWIRWLQIAEGIAYRVTLGTLAILVAWFVRRRLVSSAHTSDTSDRLPP